MKKEKFDEKTALKIYNIYRDKTSKKNKEFDSILKKKYVWGEFNKLSLIEQFSFTKYYIVKNQPLNSTSLTLDEESKYYPLFKEPEYIEWVKKYQDYLFWSPENEYVLT